MDKNIAAVTLVVGLLIGAGITYSLVIPGSIRTTTQISTQTVTQTSTITTARTTTSTITVSIRSTTSAPQKLYNVTFYEGPSCVPFVYGVQFGNSTETDPPNLTLADVQNQNYNYSLGFSPTSIVFSVPDGAYKFALYPTSALAVPIGFGSGSSAYDGMVTVTNSNITINATSSGVTCTIAPFVR